MRHRLAAILAADVVGYSRLMSADERATVLALDAARAVFRSQIATWQGRVIDMAGDSVLATFETATGAVSAALAVQSRLAAADVAVPDERQMRFRIGVHLGDIIEKADGTVYGDGVNIAARLEGLAQPGGVTVSEAVRSAVKGKLAASFDDQGEQSVKNIAEPVRAWRVAGSAAAPPPAPTSGPVARGPETAGLVIDLSLPDKPSIAVLPFTNMSDDPGQEHFCDGITEDIITELARFRSLMVIARNSSFTYKGRPVDVRTVARELGVRYVMEGSIRRAGERIRVNAQLIDALNGAHLWAEKYDRVLEDVFAVQEELTRGIVLAIAPEINASEVARALLPRPGLLSAYEIGLRATHEAETSMWASSPEARRRAVSLAEQALAADPDCLPALNALASAHGQDVFFRTAPNPKAAYQKCVAACDRSLVVDPSASVGPVWCGALEVLSRNTGMKAAGIDRLRRAHERNPHDAFVLGALGHMEATLGDHVRGRELVHQLLRISPRDPHLGVFRNTLSLCDFVAGNYASGLDSALGSIRLLPGYLPAHEHALLNHVGLGRLEDARREMDWIRQHAPEQTEMLLREGWLHLGDPEHQARATRFYRIAAGLESPHAADRVR